MDNNNNYLIFDTETTGLPKTIDGKRSYRYCSIKLDFIR